MSDQNPYEKLGVTEDASFEEIQDAKNRLSREYKDDVQLLESVEAAYDAIIMDRLRMRQEGKIKVPERIRFPDRVPESPVTPQIDLSKSSPAWLQQLLDTPSRADILISSGIYALLAAIALFAYQAAEAQTLSLVLALAFGASVYLLNRKEKRFGRSLLITLLGLLVGVGLGTLLAPIAGGGLATEQFSTLVTLFVFWLISSFLR